MSFAQESTRYCNYSQDKFEEELTFIKPCFLEEGTNSYDYWENAMADAEIYYFSMLDNGCTPQEARSVLPNSLKTEVVMTANYREWRRFFWLRAARKICQIDKYIITSGSADPQMEELTVPLLKELVNKIPYVFDDIYRSWLAQQADNDPAKDGNLTI